MPRFSILVPAYSNEEYLPACIESVLNQSFEDFELVVVVDGSPDRSGEIAQAYAEEDPRVVPLIKDENEGTHLARTTAAELCGGEYVIFLDADDELVPGALAGLDAALSKAGAVDMLHFGIEVVNVEVGKRERDSFERYINSDVDDLKGAEIIRCIYGLSGGYRQDWRVTQRVYEASFLKKAFAAMTSDRLGVAEDGYEFFVIAALAESEVTRNDVVGLKYFYGRGNNSSSAQDLPAFEKNLDGFALAISACADFAERSDLNLSDEVAGAKAKMLQLLFNDWLVRVSADEKPAAAKLAAGRFGGLTVATELARLSRDRIYLHWVDGTPLEKDDEVYVWLDLARGLCLSGEGDAGAYRDFMAAAELHLSEVGRRDLLDVWNSQDIRIFVSAHKPVDLFDSKILQPVQVGAALRDSDHRFKWALHDNEGENISLQNPLYCELTTQYWAWKNVEAKYYGFCHYRRYFDFAEVRHEENDWGEIMDAYINSASQNRYALTDEQIASAVEGWDVITTEVKDLAQFPSGVKTPWDQWKAANRLIEDDLPRVIAILSDMHPDYEEDAYAFLHGGSSCFCNMFIMRRDVFQEYCAWLFPILERFVEQTDMSLYSVEALRTPGHLSERLLNIYLLHQERCEAGLKIRRVQCVHFERPDRHSALEPVSLEVAKGRDIVPVVFAADNAYVPMLTSTLTSMMDNASRERLYDVTVLQRNISGDSQNQMRAFFEGRYDNINLRFHDVSYIMDEYDLQTSNEHISVETYYRFLIQRVLPFYDKVLYLDSDLIVKGDVAELYDTDLGSNLLGACRDVDYLGNLNMPDGERMAYTREVLEMQNPYDYFQAGVLLLNTEAMREAYTTQQWLEFASAPDFIYDDQDVLNAHCEGRVLFLDQSWNVMHDCANRVANVFSFAPADAFYAYQAAKANPKVIHYAGFEKPWNTPGCDMETEYWRYARQTPFYEALIARLAAAVGPSEAPFKGYVPPKAISENSPIRGVMDPLMPLGSARREVAKAVVRTIRRRH